MQIIKDSYIYAFNPENKPIAFCNDGEILCFETLDCFGGQVKSENDLIDNIDFAQCNPATGPVYVNGAEKGDVLAVDILDIQVADHGVIGTLNGLGPLWNSCELRTRIIPVKDNVCYFNDICFAARPMIGVIGTAPENRSVQSSSAFECGGNMDSRIITKGVSVYLPVKCKGALLAMGDVHAGMGDGEISETGIEIGAKIIVRVRIIKNFDLRWPLTETPDAYYVNTVGRNCNLSIQRGYEEIHRLIVNAYGWDDTDAVLYLSMRCFVEANQAVLAQNKADETGDTFRVGVPKLEGKPRLIP